MKSITLRTLVRSSRAVKRLTRTGQPVQVTDRGRPLWILQPATGAAPALSAPDDAEFDEELEAVLAEPITAAPLSAFVDAARR
jgi:hypothetical protein